MIEFPALWDKHGRAAGPIRNTQMLDEGRPDLVLAFHRDLSESKGTRNMVEQSVKANLPVIHYDGYSEKELSNMAAKRKAAKKGASRGRSTSSRSRDTSRDRNYDRGDDRRDDRNGGDDRGNWGGDRGGRGRGNPERTRLTGMWPSKNNRGMWTGRCTGEDLQKVLDKMTEAEKKTNIASFFMFENNRKRGPRDPDFTIYVDVGQEFKGRGNGGGRGRDDRNDDRNYDRGRGGYRDDRF